MVPTMCLCLLLMMMMVVMMMVVAIVMVMLIVVMVLLMMMTMLLLLPATGSPAPSSHCGHVGSRPEGPEPSTLAGNGHQCSRRGQAAAGARVLALHQGGHQPCADGPQRTGHPSGAGAERGGARRE